LNLHPYASLLIVILPALAAGLILIVIACPATEDDYDHEQDYDRKARPAESGGGTPSLPASGGAQSGGKVLSPISSFFVSL